MDSVTVLRSFLSAAPVETQQDFLEMFIEVKLDDQEISQAQLDDPNEWRKLAPGLIDAWEENTRDTLKSGIDMTEEITAAFQALDQNQ
jgi:hypothetical protein